MQLQSKVWLGQYVYQTSTNQEKQIWSVYNRKLLIKLQLNVIEDQEQIFWYNLQLKHLLHILTQYSHMHELHVTINKSVAKDNAVWKINVIFMAFF